MPIYLAAESELMIGQDLVLEGPAHEGSLVAVFEDDGTTGYFYALDTDTEGNPIQDALHIYDVEDVIDRDKPSVVRIGWSMDHRKALLLINGNPHAVFDFDNKQGYCRTGFPPPINRIWSKNGHDWRDDVLGLFG
ncbi:DUF2251 domain-containing protein [Pseudomonas sp. 21LCFQ010]|uniref:DUF2251 domain-containing protein n=1 Tax=Pseudomonas sp. 21LCFQ010 TaxID=2957506 RepID=UPI0020981897|nr:DUF2251 domain-containing protein [Pseudomonas sp. 21LCFQ010]MCO8161822.1 DUF2251 domain-containing protein [Pseudomonas sp. 21LCFQ010]